MQYQILDFQVWPRNQLYALDLCLKPSLRKHPFLLALRPGDVSRRKAKRNVPSAKERGETNVFAGY